MWLLIAVPGFAGFGLAGCETQVAVAELPAAVQGTARQVVGDGQITEAIRERGDDGGEIYEISYFSGGANFDAEISPDGRLLVVDEQISLSAAPEGVRAAIEKLTSGGRIFTIEKATQGDLVFYEVGYRRGLRERELRFASDGSILQR